jgi:threonine/homoserine/homoserine lactone efflux protein|tara:strand:- start:315 stop:911 length:597 start_codon:yes stop_codon:yes gene_type:complete
MEIIYFIIASFLVVIVPGPTVSLIIANSLKSGIRAGILNVVGTQLGLIVLILLLAIGFKAISPFLEDVIKAVRIIGALYLMTLGFLSFTSKSLSDNEKQIKKFDKRFILQGLIVILSNPKAFLFLGAFIPQFIDISQPIENQIIFFGILFMIVGAIFDGMYAVIFGKFREIIINKYVNLLNKLGGSLLFFVGLWLLLY